MSVDDDEVNQEVVRGALEHTADLEIAMGGQEALKYLDACQARGERYPDIVLLDVQMPGLSGFQVCEEIRRKISRSHSTMPIIMVSAKAPADNTALEGYGCGSTDFLSKPFNSEVLAWKVKVTSEKMRSDAASSCPSQRGSPLTEEHKSMMAALEQRAKDAEALAAKQAMEQQKASEDLARRLADLEQRAVAAETSAKQASDELRTHKENTERALAEVEMVKRELQQSRSQASAAENRAEELQKDVVLARSQPKPTTVLAGDPVPDLQCYHKASESIQVRKGGDGQLLADGLLWQQLRNAKTVIKVLSSRLEMLNKVAGGCHEILKLSSGADSREMSQSQLQRPLICNPRVSAALGSQLDILAQVTSRTREVIDLTEEEVEVTPLHGG